MKVRTIWLCLALSMSGCGGEGDTGPSDQAVPAVELFAPGSISSALPEFATSFTPGGDTVFFNRTTADRARIDLMMSVRTEAGWRDAIPFAPLAGVRAIDPFVSLDGRTLYFSADLPADGRASGSYNLWRIPLGGGDAPAEVLPGPLNTDSSEVFNSVSNGGVMVFSSRRDGVRALYTAQRVGDSWGTPRRLTLPGGIDGSNPAIEPEGRLLVFAHDADGGGSDLYVSCRTGEDWGAPARLPPPINSPFTDFAPGFHATYLYFTSERPGIVGAVADSVRPPGDVYRTPRAALSALCTPG